MSRASLTAVPPATLAGDEHEVELERGVRLSRSLVWRLQRTFFERAGIDAWRRGTVPHYVTSNPFIAEAYARVIAGYLRDWYAAGVPVRVVELGAGSGRFAYHLLRALLPLHRRAGARMAPFRYILTDLAASTVDFWAAHPSLRPLVDDGVLDFARFDVERDRALELVVSGERVGPEPDGAPMIVIANYFFDGLPQDVFFVEDGRLHEGLVRLCAPGPVGDVDDPALLARVRFDYEPELASEAPYADPELDRILERYRRRLARTAVRFPVAALRCVGMLRRLAGDRLLLLAADKGVCHEAALAGIAPPQLAVHGSFSLSVDFHALGEYVRAAGGRALHAAHEQQELVVGAFLLGEPAAGAHEAAQAFADAVAGFGPDDFFAVKQALEATRDQLTLRQLLAYLRLSRADARIFMLCMPALLARTDGATAAERADLRALIEEAWAIYYPIGEDADLAFHLGVLLARLDELALAATFFRRALASHGPDAHVTFNLALCHHQLRRWPEALAWTRDTLAIDPDHDGARSLLLELERRAPIASR